VVIEGQTKILRNFFEKILSEFIKKVLAFLFRFCYIKQVASEAARKQALMVRWSSG
jgi:hypothetical protein